jgi:orotidine-5'-phosphate decarboxylase
VPGHFADRLAALVEERRSRVVLGLDPDPAALWPVALGPAASDVEGAGAGAGDSELADVEGAPAVAEVAELAAAAVTRHCLAVIEAAGAACVAVKLQLACFERLGAPGWRALGEVRGAAREAGLLALADGKRGDIPVTAAAYGQALLGSTPTPFGAVEGLRADALTVNPLLGRDSLDPLIDAAADAGAGLFLLVSTSNPGAADVQEIDAGGVPLHERLATLADAAGADRTGACGLSLVGAVVAATRPARLARLRALMPRAIFLLPGVGAQGADPSALGAVFGGHPAAGLVTASRSIVGAGTWRGGDPALAAAAAAEELRAVTWNL